MAQTAEQSELPPRSVPRTARERARAEITREILEAGRRHLATDGAAALSLRAIARDLGMASSAVYRYVASRDDLLTRLIIDAYDSLGSAAESADAGIGRQDLAGRWSAICRAVRSWALANPNEWALIYGSPVPGYAAPADTIGPASRVSNLLVQILADAAERGIVPPGPLGRELSSAAKSALSPAIAVLPATVTAVALQAGLMLWSALLGTISLELFGQFHNVVSDDPADRDAFFGVCVERWAAQIGIA
ncbi:MAG: TetR/AcrR family transcriptional regulator [Nocardiopsaceae bacterium]|jgi:AcrR family transcriptional regulator|nr:TetR/AcrR family transcriptional regulator [Nocardiopsaceae bacterium]